MRRVSAAAAIVLSVLLVSCKSPATGPVKGVLVVYDEGMEIQDVNSLLDRVQLTVSTVSEEDVFAFSICSRDEFQGDLTERRTVLFLCSAPESVPEDLENSRGIYSGSDIWAEHQKVFAVVLPDFQDYGELSAELEEAYNNHLHHYIYGSFVATQMTSPARIDSLLTLGFSMDIPKSYHLTDWDPEGGFVQYQRRESEDCLLILSIRWIDDDKDLSADEAVVWRESVARNHFYDAEADSVDRSRVQITPLELRGLSGWKILGMWRNPEHINAGAFTSYVLFSGSTRYILDMEVFHEGREKEPYIREGWIIMNTFMLGENNG